MTRLRQLSTVGVTVALQEPSREKYFDMWSFLFAEKLEVRVHGEQHCLLAKPREDRPNGKVEGEFYKYTNINTAKDWVNTEIIGKATDDDVAEIHIPEHLRPNLASFSYVFIVNVHTFIFESYYLGDSISGKMALKFLSSLTQHKPFVDKFGPAAVSLIASKESLDEVLNLHELRSLRIIVRRPNSDDLGSEEEKIRQRLESMNGQSISEEIIATRGNTLTPDEQALRMAKIALRNGDVIADGKNDDGASERRSTSNKPMKIITRYDPSLKTQQQAFRESTNSYLEKLRDVLD